MKGEVAPHTWEEMTIMLERGDDVVKKCVRGDVLRVMKNEGGGGGHYLWVKNFKMRIDFKRDYGDGDEGGEVNEEAEEGNVGGGKKRCSLS